MEIIESIIKGDETFYFILVLMTYGMAAFLSIENDENLSTTFGYFILATIPFAIVASVFELFT